MSADKVLYVALSFLVDVVFGSLGVVALVASSVPVEESRLPRLLAKARMQFAAPESGPLPVAAHWWTARLVGVGFIAASQVAQLRVLTGSGPSYAAGLLWFGAVAEWATLLAWSSWVLWAFWRAAGSGGTLPLRLDPPVEAPRYRPQDKPVWTELPDEGSSEGPNGIDGRSRDGR